MSCKGPKGHLRPVHFNRGSHGHVWACLSCGKQLAGPKLPVTEMTALVEFFKYLTTPDEGKTEETNVTDQISVTVTGKSRVDLVKSLRSFADNLDGTPADEAGIEETDEATETPRTRKTTPKTTTKKAAASLEDDDDMEASGDVEETDGEAMDVSGDDDEDFTAAPAKTTKAKKITVADVNDACKVRARSAGKGGRAQVLKILKKNFKTESISEIKPEKYAAVIKAMQA